MSASGGRLYGQLADRTDYADDGTPIYSKEYVFDDIDGIFCYASTMDDGTGEPYITTGGDGVTASHVYLNSSDDGKDVSYECTVSVDALRRTTLYFNPVYRTADGSIYAVGGDAFEYAGGSEGDVYGVTLDEEYTVTENGKESVQSFSIAVQTRYAYPAQTVHLVQMDADRAVLSEALLDPENMPETFRPESAAEYIIIESHGVNEHGKPVVKRTLCQREDLTAEVFRASDNGICVPVTFQLEWQ